MYGDTNSIEWNLLCLRKKLYSNKFISLKEYLIVNIPISLPAGICCLGKENLLDINFVPVSSGELNFIDSFNLFIK